MLTWRGKLKRAALRMLYYPVYQHACLRPSYLVVGAQRAGTTSVYQALTSHPQILPASRKEVHFFDVRHTEGLAWYRSQFPTRRAAQAVNGRAITGEATPYYLYFPLSAERIARYLPDVKLIALLRDPIKRARSHYNREVGKRRETLSFDEAVRTEEERLAGEEERIKSDANYPPYNHQRFSYKARGEYVDQIDRLYAHFPAEQILLIESEWLFRDSRAELARIFAFLEVDSAEIDLPHAHNAGPGEPINPATIEYLHDYFKPYNDRLREKYNIGHSWDY